MAPDLERENWSRRITQFLQRFFLVEKMSQVELVEAASAGGWLGVVGALAGGFNKKETQTTLILIENRSGVQLAAAVGVASHTDFFGLGGAGGSNVGGALGGYSRTPEGKTLVNAFLDSMNQLVIALKDYKAQEVKGGLGKGGTLKVGQ